MRRNKLRAVALLGVFAILLCTVPPLDAGIGLFGSGSDEPAPPKPSADAFDHANAYLPETLNNQSFNQSYRAAPATQGAAAPAGYNAPAYQPAAAAHASPAANPPVSHPPATGRFPVQNAGYNASTGARDRGAVTAGYDQPVSGGANMLPAEFASKGAQKTYSAPGSSVQPATHTQPVAGTLNQGDEYGGPTQGLNQNNGTLGYDAGADANIRPGDETSSLRTAELPEDFVTESESVSDTYGSGKNLRPTDAVTPEDFREPSGYDPISSFSNANRLPEMFGDFYSTFGSVRTITGGAAFESDLPLAGGSRRVKIAEHNKPMPDSRYYFLYHNFNGALDASGPGVSQSQNVDRYTIGFEHSQLFGGNHSIEVRAPFTGGYDFNQGAFGVSGGEVGNLAVIWKSLLLGGDTWSITGGAGVDAPTGENVTGAAGGTPFKLDNSSVHLLPFLGFELRPSNRFFYQGFIQGDFAANSNTFSAGGSNGTFDEQHLLHLDFATGMWLMRDYDAPFLTGLALMGEFHYTTTFQNSDVVTLNSGGNTFLLRNPANRFDTLNAVIGVHAEISRHIALRAGWAFPLADEEFSNEVTASVIWYH